MATTQIPSPVAHSYASALLSLANDQSQAEALGQELSELSELIKSNNSFRLYLADPALGSAARGQLLQRLFDGKVSPLLSQFMKVLNRKGRAGLLPEIISAYRQMLDVQLGKLEVSVTTARPLDDRTREEVRQKISGALKKNVTMRENVDEALIGGMVLRIKDKLIDASVKTQLQTMKHKLLAAGNK